MHQQLTQIIIFILSIVVLSACTKPETTTNDTVNTANAADVIYVNANVITLDDKNTQAEAMAIKDGEIVFIGTNEDMASLKGPDTQINDLNGSTLLPGFIDAHGHFLQTGVLAMSANLLPPPDNGVDSIDKLIDALKAEENSDITKSVGWILGMGYDDAQLSEQRHPTKEDLDRVSTEIPVLAIHQSSHLGAINSKAIEVLGITNAQEDPDGGKFRRDADGNINGVVEETAFFYVGTLALSKISEELNLQALQASEKAFFKSGFTTSQEGRASINEVALLNIASEQNLLDIDVSIFPDPTFFEDENVFIDDVMSQHGQDYKNGIKVGGIKLSLDGSPQVKTAWLTKPYHVPLEGQDEDYKGYPQVPDEVLQKWVDMSHENNWQVLAHVNGDAAIDKYIEIIANAKQKFPQVDVRPVAIHAQTAREDQLDKMAELDIIASLMSVHTFYWGDWHFESVLGPERASRISPAKSALEKGVVVTSHNDAPVTLPNSQMILYSMVNRLSRSKRLLGGDERVSVEQALRAITSSAAYQIYEQDTKGTLEVGKKADMVILDSNPFEIEPEALLDLKVLETIKGGKVVYSATK
ncbi:amidohydrolase [Glaciecola petra]|uniref:Amidohydrolase n=1 Tax=Glaciecola petra TaxID=3075602 RepID=A0ABU2ZUZ9_9ALTE|nr:amidohydrolase [Aestuariibacter sp. P117]MDT0595414.1 amidohydrolase [Aestuariibacter sp. P117]